MPSGRKPVPTPLAKLHGNPSRKRLNPEEPEGQGVLWDPPSWFNDAQRAQWRYAVEYAPPGLLTATDREILVVWVVACVKHADAAVKVSTLGDVVTTKDGNIIQNPYLSILNRQALIMIRVVSELGFSPAARAGLGSRAPEFTADAGRPTTSRLTAYLARKPDRLDS
jgi:P27 family predicted phage terminase small subunit